MKLPLRDGTLAEEAGCDSLDATHLVCERQANGYRQPSAHDGITPRETPGDIEEVHRSPPARTATVGLAEHLGHQHSGGDPPRQRLPVVSIRRDDGVVGTQRLHGAYAHRLLANVEVQEASDHTDLIQLSRLLLEPADQ